MLDARKARETKDRERLRLKRSKGKAVPVPSKPKAAARPTARAAAPPANLRRPSGVVLKPTKAAVPAAKPPPFELPKLPTLPDLSNPGDVAADLAARFVLSLEQRGMVNSTAVLGASMPKKAGPQARNSSFFFESYKLKTPRLIVVGGLS